MCMCVCVCGWGGVGAIIYVFVFNAILFEFRAEHQIIFLPNKQNLKNVFIDNIFNANIFILHTKGKPVYQ